jgi:hypothetical protein
MPDDWRAPDGDADYGIREARDLLIEFVGGEPAAHLAINSRSELRKQIRSPPGANRRGFCATVRPSNTTKS